MVFSELQKRLGGEISPELLQQALTHSSYAYEKGGENNERLEFLGDSILGYLVAVFVFKNHQDLQEGELTTLKNGVVSAQALATAANRIGLGEFLLLGKGEEQTQGRSKINILADAFEAILGAAYLTAGIESAAAIVERHIYPLLDDPDAVREASDPKTSLNEKLQKLKLEHARYEITGTGPEHEMIYTALCFTCLRRLSEGQGTTKRSAETQAAIQALRELAER
jgi:ribonuclease-3